MFFQNYVCFKWNIFILIKILIDGKIIAFGKGETGLIDDTAVDEGIIFFLTAHLSGTGINCSMKCQELASAQKTICYLSRMAPVGNSRKWNYKLLPLTIVMCNSNHLGPACCVFLHWYFRIKLSKEIYLQNYSKYQKQKYGLHYRDSYSSICMIFF